MRVDEDAYFGGTLQAKTFVPSAACVGDSHVSASYPLGTTKTKHKHHLRHGVAGTPADATIPLAVIVGATATLVNFKAWLTTACTGAAKVELDLLKNGTTMLSAVIQIDNGDAARAVLSATLSVTALVAGDVLEVTVNETAGGGTVGTGLGFQVELDEDAQ